jgi:hypothetical protein
MSPIVGLRVTVVKSSVKYVVIKTVCCHTTVQFITTQYAATPQGTLMFGRSETFWLTAVTVVPSANCGQFYCQ